MRRTPPPLPKGITSSSSKDKVPIKGLELTSSPARAKSYTKPLHVPAHPTRCAAITCTSCDTIRKYQFGGDGHQARWPIQHADLGDLTWNTEHDLACPST